MYQQHNNGTFLLNIAAALVYMTGGGGQVFIFIVNNSPNIKKHFLF